MESKDLLSICRQAGIDVKNQLSTLEPDQRDKIVALVQKGSGVATATQTARPAAVATPPQAPARIRNLDRPQRAPAPKKEEREHPSVEEQTPPSPVVAESPAKT